MAFLAPLIYIAIITGLIFIQFSGGGIFTENLGQILLSGTLDISSDIKNPAIASVMIEYEGLRFSFDEKNPLRIETAGGEHALHISGYRRDKNSVVLYFENNTELEFQNDSNAEQLIILNNLRERFGEILSMRLPFRIATGVNIQPTENFPGLDISNGDERYILALPPRSYINDDLGLINIPGEEVDKSIRYTKRAAGNETVFDLWFQNQMEEIPASVFTGEINDYIDRAYLAWQSNRYNPTTGTWRMRDEPRRFREAILISLLSEAWKRNEYNRAFNEMRNAADIFPLELSYRSSVFLGNLRKVTNDLDNAERQESIRISNMINQGNAMVFIKEELFQYATDRRTPNLLNNLLRFTENLSPTNLTGLESLGISMNYYLGKNNDAEISSILARFEDLIEEKVLPDIARVDEGFFFQTEPGIADSYYTVLAAQTFIAAGEQRSNEKYVHLGRNMLLSVLRLGDQMGFLPAKIELTAGAISATLGTLPPENIYHLIHNNPYYPRHISLSNEFGAGSWMYSLIGEFQRNSSPGELSLNFQNTPSRTHYIFFRNIPPIDPLNGMELFGIIWRNAPDFEIYSKGRYYNADSRTLMVKFFDDERNQKIKLYY